MKNVLLIWAFLMPIVSPSAFGLSSDIDFSYTKLDEKNIDFSETTLLYKNILGYSQKTIAPTFKNLYGFTTDQVSTSLTNQSRAQELMNQSTQASLSQALSQIKRYFKKNIRNSFLPDLEAAPSTPVQAIPVITSSDILLEKNKFTPKINVGTDYVKPVLSMGNSLNSGVDTNVSYHSKDKTLEAIVSKKLSENTKILIENMNLFSANNEKRVIFGIQYRF